MTTAPSVRVREVLLYECPVRLRMPFRFGVVTLDRGVQAFVRARVSLGDEREAWGVAAEMLAPKWFDKDGGGSRRHLPSGASPLRRSSSSNRSRASARSTPTCRDWPLTVR